MYCCVMCRRQRIDETLEKSTQLRQYHARQKMIQRYGPDYICTEDLQPEPVAQHVVEYSAAPVVQHRHVEHKQRPVAPVVAPVAVQKEVIRTKPVFTDVVFAVELPSKQVRMNISVLLLYRRQSLSRPIQHTGHVLVLWSTRRFVTMYC